MYTPNQIADYIIFKLNSDEQTMLSNLKLQKLLYYSQAWHLAFTDTKLFDGKFQAWVHGPVNRQVYERFKDTKFLYSPINLSDINEPDFIKAIDENAAAHISSVLDVYAPFSATDLEIMTHREEPWVRARHGYSPTERCDVEIDETIMREYYKKRLQ